MCRLDGVLVVRLHFMYIILVFVCVCLCDVTVYVLVSGANSRNSVDMDPRWTWLVSGIGPGGRYVDDRRRKLELVSRVEHRLNRFFSMRLLMQL